VIFSDLGICFKMVHKLHLAKMGGQLPARWKPLERPYCGHHARGSQGKPLPNYWECMEALYRAYGIPEEEEKQDPPRKREPINLESWE
jgi:hypothetical protein